MKRTLLLILASTLIFGSGACVVSKKDNGKHKGWYKNPNNPHHPASTKGKQGSSGHPSNGQTKKK